MTISCTAALPHPGSSVRPARTRGERSVAEPTRLRVLLVEDSDFDAHLVLAQLQAAAVVPYTVRHVVRAADAREELTLERTDCVLLDLNLPDATGLEGLVSLVASHPEVPIVVLSGS